MARIVLVHGIAQEQYGADVLESQWIPALASGIRVAGFPALADRLGRGTGSGSIETRMAFYGNLFLDPGAQGAHGPRGGADTDPALREALAAAWLAAAAERLGDPGDRERARRYVEDARLGDDGAQGAGRILRPAAHALTRLRWFAPFGFGLAARFVDRALSQVIRYLEEPSVRAGAQDRVLALLDPRTRVVIAHSLGSVVAYEALHRAEHPVTLITLGSPLALPSIIHPRLRPRPPHVPIPVRRWDNFADADDIVATPLDLAPHFPPAPGSHVVATSHLGGDNGARPHDAGHYLTKSGPGRVVAESLDTG